MTCERKAVSTNNGMIVFELEKKFRLPGGEPA